MAQLRLFRSPSLLIYTITGVRTHVAAGPLNGIPNLCTMLILKCLASKILNMTWFYEQKEIALKRHILVGNCLKFTVHTKIKILTFRVHHDFRSFVQH